MSSTVNTITNKSFLRSKLNSILEYKHISISGAELRSYTKKELNLLINKYDIKLKNANHRDNYWYRALY
jgi:hypothetical protein